MTKLVPILVLITGLMATVGARAATDAARAARMAECYRRHGQLMDKPSVRNERACWMAHAYLMDRG